MRRIGFESLSDSKSQLVLEICSMATSPVACCHRHRIKHLVRSHFIDWYRLLGVCLFVFLSPGFQSFFTAVRTVVVLPHFQLSAVQHHRANHHPPPSIIAEDAGLELIKRRYHKLALQLHPDKNKHPKAEVAFKLVSEAYSCLSDNVKRRAFNSERRKHFCIECDKIPYSSPNLAVNNISQHSSKPKAQDPMNCSNPERSMQILKDIRNRLEEEIRVVEHCLKVNRRRETPVFNPPNNHSETKHRFRRETPIFEPSEYYFHGYPHLRSEIYRENELFSHFKRGSLKGRRGGYDSPVFENESEKRRFKGV
ncbi:hypothetical protein V6N11_068693 [Hibiscus sabdariffa]|uniref:J domain-containing protein n=1 Tax=Hibiscus sabdariffa TaxID=183260 RepID=A0ABR2PAJ9_9ROSI